MDYELDYYELDYFDGLVNLMSADADIIDVTGSAPTASTVIADLGAVIDAIPETIYGYEDEEITIELLKQLGYKTKKTSL